MAMALMRASLNGSSTGHVALDVLSCGFLSLALFPLLDFRVLNQELATTLGAITAFLGLDWTLDTLKAVVAARVSSWAGSGLMRDVFA